MNPPCSSHEVHLAEARRCVPDHAPAPPFGLLSLLQI